MGDLQELSPLLITDGVLVRLYRLTLPCGTSHYVYEYS